MGSSFSTPSPVKALIGQFDRLQLCSKEKKRVDDDTSESSKAPVVSQTDFLICDRHNNCKYSNGHFRWMYRQCPKLRRNSLSIFGSDMRTGEDFLVLLESVRSRLEASTKQVLAELDEMKSIPEEAASSIRLAAGKAQLLVRKKLSKFDELVKKNLNPVDGDLQPATIDDLEGYWALVEIELNDIDECFQKVDEWRSNGWQLKESPESQDPLLVNSNNNNNIAKKKIVTTRPATVPIDPEVRAKQVEKQ
ncbi:hypothetical protein OSTOST_23708, partial [Ostertagia ostertagi]